MLNSKKALILSISLLGVFMLAIIGVTYAYVGVLVKGNESPEPSMDLQTGYLAIKYSDGTSSLSTEGDKVIGGSTFTKTFTVANTGAGLAYYSVWFRDVENPFVRTQDWTYILKSGDTIISSGTVPTKDEVIVSARGIDYKAKDNLTLTITYAKTMENQIEDINKTLEFNIGVNQGISSFDTAEDGTLLYAIGNNTSPTSAYIAKMMDYKFDSTEDNYGTSYYFSGNPTNNYVNFKGMCWRIVRIQGDGNIKLVLADESNLCNSENYSKNNETSAFINKATPNAYDIDGQTSEAVAFETSDISNLLNTWKEKVINSNNLVNTKWCNDTTYTNGENNILNYGAYTRLNNELNPNLKCNRTIENNIGLLSADEIVFAGSQVNTSKANYLLDNANSDYWTMSPYTFDTTPNMWGVNATGALTNIGSVTNTNVYVRPAIVLAKSTLVSEGNGTVSNPYIINE